MEVALAEHFMGLRSHRYLLTLRDAVAEHVAVEPSFEMLTCTRPSTLSPVVLGG